VNEPSEEGAGRPAEPPVPPTVVSGGGGGAGRRLLAAALLVPWLLAYGITGSWAVTRGAQGLAQHLHHVDAGYTRPVTPASLVVVGALVLAGFAVLLAVALLLVVQSHSRGAWTAALVAALLLVAGALWAGVAGHMHPGLWLLLFFGLLLAAALAAFARFRVPRRPGRATMAAP
jgi:hypothetical protein